VISFKEALTWSGIWIALALLFNLYLYFTMGSEAAVNFLTGYLIEKTLSVDNLFVFLFIFDYFQTPESSLHKVLFWGVFGAIFTRALFILLGVTLVSYFHPIIYLFGLFLVVTGIRLGFGKTKKIDPENNFLLKLSRRFLPVTQEYSEDRFFIRKNSQIFATPLWIVLLSIEATDIIFAIDSIPAILAITYDPFIIYTSNIFAILGLRSLYFLLAGSLKLFRHLHYGISVILVFVGMKMLLSDILKIPPWIALGVICAILVITILASILIKRKKENKKDE
jgi:tellurite resistance protein TerC